MLIFLCVTFQIENLRTSLHKAENELRSRDAEIRKSAEAERNAAAQLQLQVSKLSADNKKLQVSCYAVVSFYACF